MIAHVRFARIGVGPYTAKHFYRTLVVGVLGKEMPGDEFYDMSSGADKQLFNGVFKKHGVIGLDSYCRFVETHGDGRARVVDVAELSYKLCMAADGKYMAERVRAAL